MATSLSELRSLLSGAGARAEQRRSNPDVGWMELGASRGGATPQTQRPVQTQQAPPATTPTRPNPTENPLSQMSVWDKFTYGQSEAGQQRWVEDQLKVPEEPSQEKIDYVLGITPGGGWDANLDEGQAQRREQASARREETAARSRLDTGLGDGGYNTRNLTTEEFNALNPAQQAAVEANTAIYRAVQGDLSDRQSARDVGDSDYDALVADLFGEQGGSGTYAPRTAAVLQQLNLQREGDDLDNFLNLSSLVTDDDLGYLDGAVADTTRDWRNEVRRENALNISEAASSALGETLAAGRNLLEAAAVDNSDLFPGINADAALGFSLNEEDTADMILQDMYEAMQRGDEDASPERINTALGNLELNYGVPLADSQNYFRTRLRAEGYDPRNSEVADAITGEETAPRLSTEEFWAKYFGGN